MRRRVWTRLLLAGALFALACDQNPLAPELPELNVVPAPNACSPALARQILVEIGQIYRARPLLELQAALRFAVIAVQCPRKPADARARAVLLSGFAAEKFQNHRLLSSISWADVSRHIDHLYQYVGLPAPGIPATSVGAGAAVAVVEPTDPEQSVTTGDDQAGVRIPTGAISPTQTVLVTITLDPTHTNPFPNTAGLQEFPPFYDFRTFPEVPVFNQPVLVGICVDLTGVPSEQAHRLQLAHPHHPDLETLELLPRVAAEFLPCASFVRAGSDAVNLAQAKRTRGVARLAEQALALFRPQPLYAATLLAGGLGGQTTSFSDFRAVDPGAPSADLTISAPATLTVTPSSVAAGGQVALSNFTVTNQGSVASNSFRVGRYLSADATITTSDVLLGLSSTSSTTPLAAGESFTFDGGIVTIPAGTTPGNYFIGPLVDDQNGTVESNEGNNFKSTALTVTAPVVLPDLTIHSLTYSPANLTPSDAITLSGVVSNSGGNAIGSGLISLCATEFTLFGSTSSCQQFTGPSVGAGGSTPVSRNFPPLLVGAYTITASVDSFNTVPESNETNNQAVGPTFGVGLITFESYPGGSSTCGDCKVGSEFAGSGVTFSFVTFGGVDTLPHICNSTPNDPPGGPVNHAVTAPAVGDPCNGWISGDMTMTFSPHRDTVTFRLRGPDPGSFDVTAYDGSGAVLPGTQVIHSVVGTYTPAGPGASGTRREERITVINPIGKISKVKVGENGSIRFLDNLRMVGGGFGDLLGI